VCAGYPPVGVLTPAKSSLWLGVPDYNFESGATTGLSMGILNDDPSGWPIQQSSIDNIPKLFRTDAMSQFDLEGEDMHVSIERGDTISDVGPFARCSRPLVPQLYRQWTMRVEVGGRVVNQRVVIPEQGGRFILPNESFQFYSEFLAARGPFTAQYWNFEAHFDGEAAWRPVTSFRTFGNYDGTGFDFGVRKVLVNGSARLEFSNRAGTYLLGDRIVTGL
jgi:hypothetical protein